jgi:NAD+ synthase
MKNNLKNNISNWIKNYSNKFNIETLIVGVSGGIDSAVTSTLCAETGLKTIVINMPIRQSSGEINRGEEHMAWLKNRYKNVSSKTVNLDKTFNSFLDDFSLKTEEMAEANTRSRLRMVTLYHMAAQTNGIVVGTGNKVEDFGVGFYTKYGDGGVDISPIADLLKSEVYSLGKDLEIIDSIMKAPPTDGLWGDTRTDEDQIGASYDELEWAMLYKGNLNSLSKRQKEVYEIYTKFNNQNKHKMNPIPIYKSSNQNTKKKWTKKEFINSFDKRNKV